MFQPTEQLAPRALAFAVLCHAGQRRESDGSPFINHPLEVARLLRDAGCAETVVAAGLLHDVVEETEIDIPELHERFGRDVAALVDAVTDDSCIESYRLRKQLLRDQVRHVGGDAALLFAADKISNLRELPTHMRRDQARLNDLPDGSRTRRYLERHSALRMEHYRASLAMLEQILPGHELVTQFGEQLDRCSSECRLLN